MKFDAVYVIKLVIVAALLYILAYVVKKVAKKILDNVKNLDDRNKETILNVTHNSVMGFGILFFIVYAISPFVDLSKLLAGAGVLTLVIGFAVSNILKDLFAGFMRVTTKQLRSGDLVVVNGKTKGNVEQIGLLYLQVRQFDGSLTTFNHAAITEFQNTNMEKRRVIVEVVTSFRENPNKVITLLEDVARQLNEENKEWLYTEEEEYKVTGLTSTNEQFFGYKYALTGLVGHQDYYNALNHARLLVAQTMYDNHIQMAEQNVYFKTRAELQGN